MTTENGQRPGSRWLVKKAARRGLAVVSGAWRAAPGRTRPEGRVRVLTYHRISDSPYDAFAVAPEHFDAQIK